MRAAALDRLLILAGPSGVGKDRFFQDLRAGTLGGAIAAHIPKAAVGWPTLLLQDHAIWMAEFEAGARSGRPTAGAILHVDTTGVCEGTSQAAPALAAIALAEVVTLVRVVAPADRIADRLLHRVCTDAVRRNPAAERAVATLRARFAAARGRPADLIALRAAALAAGIRPKYVRRLAFYRTPGWMEKVDTAGTALFARACAGREVRMLTVESSATPAPGGFRLIGASARTFPIVTTAVVAEGVAAIATVPPTPT